MRKIKNLIKNENTLFYLILFGVLILSAGVALIKINSRIGTSLIILGSSLFYVGVVILAFTVK
jgi:hypothetical protein